MRLLYGCTVLSLVASLAGCTRDLAGAPCPCADGFKCCANRCIPAEEPCSTTLVISAPGAYWQTDQIVTEVAAGAPDVYVSDAVDALRQTWEGFGGAFSELGWQYLAVLGENDRNHALELLFGDDYARFNMGRIPIGANDYSVARYTLNETAGDTEMAHFSVDRDLENLIPYVRAAAAIRPNIHFWASPWTPPTWMKNGPFYKDGVDAASRFDGGTMKEDSETLRAYAGYFVKFVQQYAELGIRIETVAPQNEPSYGHDTQAHPSCAWAPTTYARFVGQFLGPALEAAELDTRIMLGTLSRNGEISDVDFLDAVMSDDRAKSYVKVVGAQWGMLDRMASAKPSALPLWQTEHMGGNCPFTGVSRCKTVTAVDKASPAPNDHDYAVESWNNLHDWIGQAGVSSYTAWNMVLDSLGAGIDSNSNVVWHQNALLVVNTALPALTVTPTYHVFRHISHYVEPGARVAAAATADGSSLGLSALAFKNPSGALVTVLFNAGQTKTAIVAAHGKLFSFEMPGNGWATLVLQ